MITAKKLRKKKAKEECGVWLQEVEVLILEADAKGKREILFTTEQLSYQSVYLETLVTHLKGAYGFKATLISGREEDSVEVSW